MARSKLDEIRREAALLQAQAEKAEASVKLKAWQAVENSYKGGIPTRSSEPWQASQGFRFGSSQDRLQITNACDRAYEVFRNNPVGRTLVQTETDNVIGDGANYQPTTDSEAWNREAVDRYYDWIENCTVRGADIMTGCEFQREAWKLSRVAGDVGWILVARGSESRVQLVPRENIVTPDGMFADRSVFDGIRYDATGAPLSYYVLYYDEQGIGRKFQEVMARDFVWLPHMSMPGQSRGETCYMTIFDLLANLDRYIDGVSLAAWMATVFSIVFKQNNAGKQLGLLPSIPNSQGEMQKAITVEKSGMVKYIGTDEDVAQVQAHQPMQQTPEFIRTMFRMLGQPFDMPLEVVAKDMSVCTFASARIGLLPFYRSCRIKFGRFGSRWSRTIRWWLSRERLRPRDDPKRWKTPFPEDFWRHELLPNTWEYTDPVSEAQADLLQMDMGTKSTQMVIAERGRDAEKILRERQEWREKTKDLPMVHSTLTRHPQTGVGAQGDPLGQDQVLDTTQQDTPPDEQGNSNGNE